MTARTTTRVDALYMARVYIAQARVQRHRGAWRATMLRWAAKCRRAAMAERATAQRSLI